ncbi:MAG: hypothetical protein IKR04_05840 [Clostridia bacterium]|nr:hypothetical protein [Clostridia bacterium]
MKKASNHVVLSSLFKAVVLTLIIAMLGTGVIYAGNNSITSKALFTKVLKDLSVRARQYAEMMPDSEFKSGTFSYESKTKYSDESYVKTYGVSNSDEKYEVSFKDGKYLIKTSKFKALYDKVDGRIYARRIENNKEIGDTFYLDDFSSYDMAPYELEEYLDKLDVDVGDSSSISQKAYYEMFAMAIDYATYNLKDSYFKDSEENGIHIYTLEMNKDDISELLISVVRNLVNDKKFCELAKKPDTYTNEDLEADIKDLKESLDQLDDLKLVISIYTKSLTMEVAGGRIEFCDGKENGIEAELRFEKNRINIDFDRMSYDHILNESTFDYDKQLTHSKVSLLITTEDDKPFDQTSKIIASYKSEDSEIIVILAGDSGKSLLESSKVSLSLKAGNHDLSDILVVSSEDGKGLDKSSKINVEIYYGGASYSGTISSNDKKSIMDSNDIKLEVSDSVEIRIRILDKKSFKNIMKSTNLSINARFGDYKLYLTYKGDSEFKKAKRMNLDATLEMGEEKIVAKLNVESKDGKSIFESARLKGTASLVEGKNKFEAKFDSKEGYTLTTHTESNWFVDYVSDVKQSMKYNDKLNIDKLMNTKKALKTDDVGMMKVLDPDYVPIDYSTWLLDDDWSSSYDDYDDIGWGEITEPLY